MLAYGQQENKESKTEYRMLNAECLGSKTMYINIKIKVPAILANLVLWFVLRYRKKHYGYTFRCIKLTKDKFTIVDVEDYQKLAQHDWHLWESGSYNQYAIRYEKGKSLKMHREIMNAPVGLVVDHKNGDGLDNRKENLRVVTRTQNHYNRRKTIRKTTSKYKGVHRITDRKAYCAKIRYKCKTIFLGYYKDEIEAAKAYDEAARKFFGEFARLNFTTEGAENFAFKEYRTQNSVDRRT
jgi:hypothetical protein